MDTVEVTKPVLDYTRDDWSVHAYFCTNIAVLTDMGRVFVSGHRASDAITLTMWGSPNLYWQLNRMPRAAVSQPQSVSANAPAG